MQRNQFGKKNPQGRRFHCEYCQLWVIGDRSDIKNHNGTAIHKRNYQRHLDDRHNEARKKKIASGYYDDKQELLEEYTRGQDKKLQRKEKYEENKQRGHWDRTARFREGTEDDNQMLNGAVSKEQMFAAREKRNRAGGKKKRVWDLVIDEGSGKIVFLNLLTGQQKDEKPYGLLLSKEDEELWQRSRENKIDYRDMPTFQDLNTKVGQWQDVKQHENFFQIHAAGLDDDNMLNSDEEDNQKKQDQMDQIFKESGGDMSKALDQILQIGDGNTHESGEVLKGKRLEELAKNGVDLDFGEIGNIDMELQFQQVLDQNTAAKDGQQVKKSSGFRKKAKKKKKKSSGLLSMDGV